MADSRNRGDGIQQRFMRVNCIEFTGSQRLEHREGGNKPLYVKETMPGVFLSSWVLTKEARKFIRELANHPRRDSVLSIIIDTNVPGHPTVSMQIQEIFITEN
jgi:hypothetical protein